MGQPALVPVQDSARITGPAAARQVVVLALEAVAGAGRAGAGAVFPRRRSQRRCGLSLVLGLNESVGQRMLLPLHFSATSEAPTEARHSAPLGFKLSDGRVALLPVQYSATSQAPAALRHDVVAGLKVSVGQLPDTPSQVSATSRTLVAGGRSNPSWPSCRCR